jgi:hypothetical protein
MGREAVGSEAGMPRLPMEIALRVPSRAARIACGRGRAVAILSVVMLTACAPSTAEGLRQERHVYRFKAMQDYRTVFANETDGMVRCMTGSYFQFTFAIRPKLVPAERKASLSYVHRGLGEEYWGLIDILGSDDGTTVQSFTTSHPLMREFGQWTEKWANGSKDCPDVTPVHRHFPIVVYE